MKATLKLNEPGLLLNKNIEEYLHHCRWILVQNLKTAVILPPMNLSVIFEQHETCLGVKKELPSAAAANEHLKVLKILVKIPQKPRKQIHGGSSELISIQAERKEVRNDQAEFKLPTDTYRSESFFFQCVFCILIEQVEETTGSFSSSEAR